MAETTQMTGAYAASWLPWLMIPLICYILPFPAFAIIFLWIEREGNSEAAMGQDATSSSSGFVAVAPGDMGADPTSSS